jgi:hypothetical protein
MLLAENEQFADAEEAFARAEERGHRDAAHNLAVVREYRQSIGEAGSSPDANEPVPDTVPPPTRDLDEWFSEDAVQAEPSGYLPAEDVAGSPAAQVVEPGADADRRKWPRAGALTARRSRRLAAGVVLAVGIAFAAMTAVDSKGPRPNTPSTVTNVQDAATTSTRPAAPSVPQPSAKTHPNPAPIQTPAHVNAPDKAKPKAQAKPHAVTTPTTSTSSPPVAPSSSGANRASTIQVAPPTVAPTTTPIRSSPPVTPPPSPSTSTGSGTGTTGSGTGSSGGSHTGSSGTRTGGPSSHGGTGTAQGSNGSGTNAGTGGGGSGTVAGGG